MPLFDLVRSSARVRTIAVFCILPMVAASGQNSRTGSATPKWEPIYPGLVKTKDLVDQLTDYLGSKFEEFKKNETNASVNDEMQMLEDLREFVTNGAVAVTQTLENATDMLAQRQYDIANFTNDMKNAIDVHQADIQQIAEDTEYVYKKMKELIVGKRNNAMSVLPEDRNGTSGNEHVVYNDQQLVSGSFQPQYDGDGDNHTMPGQHDDMQRAQQILVHRMTSNRDEGF